MRGRILWVILTSLLVTTAAWGDGRIEGQITNEAGKGLGGVTVVVNETGQVALSENNGRFAFSNVPAGSYTVSFTLDENADSEEVEVADGATTRVEKVVGWELSFADTITIYSASRRTERIVEAPAAVTVIPQEQIERESTHGQLPKLLEHTPGAEVTQSGLYDFNFNTRGFNSSLNRRVLTLIDGRNPSVTFLGNQEWAALTVPLDELESVELVRGPGSALYGVDAFNGVINMVTKAPRDSRGGKFKLTVGDLDTVRGDLTVSGELGNNWFGRLIVGALESEDFAVSRVDLNGNGVLDVPAEAEYEGLNPPEVIPLPQDTNEFFWGTARVDRHFESGHVLTLETGLADGQSGGVAITGIGRVQTTDFYRPYFRVNYNAPKFNFLAYHNIREADDSRSLRSGAPLFLDSDRTLVEVQGNTDFSGGKGRLVGGATYSEETFNSLDDSGMQTLVFEKVDEDYQGIFGQLEYDLSKKLKGVFSARFDDSSRYDSQFSPRGALVYAFTPNHTLRASYSEAFQRPNYSEYFLQVGIAPPLPINFLAQQFAGVDLEATFCAPFGVDCGFNAVPLLALGNNTLEVEEVETFEVGYSGILGGKVFFTADYYNSTINNFLTDLIFAVSPTLGRINPGFQPYQAPGALPAPVAAALEGTLQALLQGIDQSGALPLPFPISPILSNNPVDGSAIFSALSYTNFGEVDTQGIEIGLNANVSEHWLVNLTYNWFDFDIQNQLPEDPIVPNAPENQYGFGVSYNQERFGASVRYRHVDGFFWNAGVFSGDIPSYDLVDLTANYDINDRFQVGLNVSNLFDEDHYQIFAGDIIERRVLGHFQIRW